MTNASVFSRSLAAETLKLKRTPLLWIAIGGGLFVTLIVFLIFVFNKQEVLNQNQNPWELYFKMGYIITTMMLLVPYIVLVMSALTYFEHHANAWKYLYTLPLRKENFYFAKFLIAIGLIVILYLTFFGSFLASGYLLDFIHPEYQFQRQDHRLGFVTSSLLHSFISILGITAIQFWLSMRWQNFILPIAIGLLGFIVGFFLLLARGFELTTFFPYAHAGLMSYSYAQGAVPEGIQSFGSLTHAELASIGCFFFFAFFGFFEEKNSDVK